MSQSHLSALFRTTKTRNVRSQEQLRSGMLKYKQSSQNLNNEVSYHQTYGIPLTSTAISILSPIISSLIGMPADINPNIRTLYTIGIWIENISTIYRCCFMQPMISSMTCSFQPQYKSIARDALYRTRDMLPDAIPCTLNTKNNFPQLSGRMVPYVTENFNFEVSWGFANISSSYILFIRTDDTAGQILQRISPASMDILRHFFPSYSICIIDVKTNSHKITVTPDSSSNMEEPNKNTCMYINGDGSFRLQGKPSMMAKVCQSFREAICSIAVSHSWTAFTNNLTVVDQTE